MWGSVDAATPETYAKTRGGNFSTVARHATELSELRRQNPFDLTLGFVVSAPNYHEMPDFAEWAGRLGARAEFLRIQDWGHLPEGSRFNLSTSDRPSTRCTPTCSRSSRTRRSADPT